MTTICLNMIVRDEEQVVRETLDSVRKYITDYVIVDTGSTDDTIKLLRTYFQSHGISGYVIERPWRSFGKNRTEAMELARKKSKSEYLWVIDADDIVTGHLDFSRLTADGYFLRYDPDFEYWRLQLFRRESPWRYVGVLHEYADCSLPEPCKARLEGDYHIVSRRLGARNRDPDKYRKDAAVLENALAAEPNNSRYIFYLGQSWFDAGEPKKALAAYRRRIEMGGWEEELFYSRFRVAQCMELLGLSWLDTRLAYMKCFEHHPARAEPLVEVARHERIDGNFNAAYEAASRAALVPRPEPGALFIQDDVYEYRAYDELAIAAYYLGYHEQSFRLNSRILARADISEQERQRIEANRDFSVPLIMHVFLHENTELVRQVSERQPVEEPRVTLTVTSCKRLDLFVKTIRSFLHACTDIDRIDQWICIDDNSSEADRCEMKRLFPFFEFIWKNATDRGHARSMNILIDRVQSPYWLHLEDDWHFFERLPYVGQALEVLENDRALGQVLFNRHYAEDLNDRSLIGGNIKHTRSGLRYVEHLYLPDDAPGYDEFWDCHRGLLSNAWWPHYSLRPSLLRTSAIRNLAPFNEDAPHFELEMARRYEMSGLRSSFFDTISSLHTGRRTSEIGPGVEPNAYELNHTNQFGLSDKTSMRSNLVQINPPAVTVTMTSCKRLDYFIQTMESVLCHLGDCDMVTEWICVDDNSTEADRNRMAELFPFVRFINKSPDMKGHANSMNILLDEVKTRFVFHLEDDWCFSRGLKLSTLTRLLLENRFQQVVLCARPCGQCLKTSADGVLVEKYGYSPQHPEKPEAYRAYDALYSPGQGETRDDGWWWPGFTLNPSLFDVEFFRSRVGRFNEKIATDMFEYDYAARAHIAGARILVTDYRLTHIGDMSAYVLNHCPRWWDSTVSKKSGHPRIFSHLD